MKFAYADPPYPGQARKHYRCAEIDHEALIYRLTEGYPDGWALSTSSPALEEVLCLCRRIIPNQVRVSAWVKPFASFKRGVNPAYAWEPIVWLGGRSATDRGGKSAPTIRDWHSANITLRKGLSGAKPGSFCLWLLDLLGYRSGDTMDDLYPGTGIMGKVAPKRVA